MSKTLDFTCRLIEQASVTPHDADCQSLLRDKLAPLGFHCETLNYGDVTNLWAKRAGNAPLLVFAGHTDVVPPGPLSAWDSAPFSPRIEDGILYGRGAADMKGSLAAMISACEKFTEHHPHANASLGFLITSDEEGDAINGTAKVMQHLHQNNEQITWCIVGEPSSSKRLGDVIRNGRRGSLSGILKIRGLQGHVAYPHLADNALHRCLRPLQDLCDEVWDQGNEFFPATSMQISNLHAGSGPHNIIPGEADVIFNFRFSTAVTAHELQVRTQQILERHGLTYDLEWRLFGEPFFTAPGKLTNAVSDAIMQVVNYRPELSTGGGTSDGRFIAPYGVEVIELGPINASIHKVNEHVNIADLDLLADIYYQTICKLFLT